MISKFSTCVGAQSTLASFPTLVRGWRKKSLVHTVCACSVPPGFLGNLEISVNLLRYTNLHEACRLLQIGGGRSFKCFCNTHERASACACIHHPTQFSLVNSKHTGDSKFVVIPKTGTCSLDQFIFGLFTASVERTVEPWARC